MAKGVQPITTASLATPKISGIAQLAKPTKIKPTPANKLKSMSALFGTKRPRPTVQSVPTKVSAF